MKQLCGRYLGDNDGTCPQLTCIREHGHSGLCDNTDDRPDWTVSYIDRRGAQNALLLSSIKRALPKLRELLAQMSAEWYYEDAIYRFYHQSFKVYSLQSQTLTIFNTLAALHSGPLNPWFVQIVEEGTNKKFDHASNAEWLQATRPIVEAFFHAKYFLEMVVKYGSELEEAPSLLPSGWASVLNLYEMR